MTTQNTSSNGHTNGRVPIIKVMRVGEIVPLHSNPEVRTADVRELKEYVALRQGSGQSPLPGPARLIIGNDGVLGDGHRRLQTLKDQGVEEVEVEIDPDRDAETIWAEANSNKNLTLRQISVAMNQGFPREKIPAYAQRAAKRLEKLVGEAGVDLAVRSGHSMGISTEVRKGLKFMDATGDQEMGYKLLAWMIKYNANYLLRSAITSGGVTPAKLRRRVLNDKPLID